MNFQSNEYNVLYTSFTIQLNDVGGIIKEKERNKWGEITIYGSVSLYEGLIFESWKFFKYGHFLHKYLYIFHFDLIISQFIFRTRINLQHKNGFDFIYLYLPVKCVCTSAFVLCGWKEHKIKCALFLVTHHIKFIAKHLLMEKCHPLLFYAFSFGNKTLHLIFPIIIIIRSFFFIHAHAHSYT